MILAATDAATESVTHAMLMTTVTAIAGGVILTALARKLRLPAIVLLLLGGILLGPAVWAEHALVQPDTLGDGLRVIVSLFVGLILFEGGLTLDLSGYRSAPAMIWRLLTIGVLTTWFGTALAIALIFDLNIAYAILTASLVIVTGPTVIAPLLKRVKVTSRLHNILHWEGVLIDPIGVFIALLCFEYFIHQSGQEAAMNFGLRVAAGMTIGIVGGLGLTFITKRRFVPEEMVNVFALGYAVLIFGITEAVSEEAGLLAMAVAGFTFGLTGSYRLKQVRAFKAEIIDLLIGTLFILLASRLSFDQFEMFGLGGLLVVAIVIFVVRPLAITICSWKLDFALREKAFLSWVAPRGIVAASMASLFAIELEQFGGLNDPRFVETFTYSVIVTTIVLQGSTAGWLAKILHLKRPDPIGWLIVGAHLFGRRIAQFIEQSTKLPVLLIDSNARAVRVAGDEGFDAFTADARDTALVDRREFQVVGNVLALTDNEDLNVRICQNWAEVVGSDHVYRCDPTGSEVVDDDSGDSTGKVVWNKLPKPTLVAAELQRGDSMALEAEGNEHAFAQFATPIARFIGGRIIFDQPQPAGDNQTESDKPAVKTLYIQRQANYLLRAIRPEMIWTIEADDLQTFLTSLVDQLVAIRPALPRDEIVEELVERESNFPTALGHGVAVPHAYSSALDERVCAIVRIPAGLDFGAPDGEPVRLVFLLISPQGDPEGHLATLAEIARLVIEPEVREQLLEVPSPLEVIRTVRSAHRT